MLISSHLRRNIRSTTGSPADPRWAYANPEVVYEPRVCFDCALIRAGRTMAHARANPLRWSLDEIHQRELTENSRPTPWSGLRSL
jgi:hypothetical protein